MKTCFKSGELPHIWAHQRATEGRVSGSQSQSFYGKVFRSYATDIAVIVEHAGKRAYVVDTARFSVTTSGIQSAVLGAIPHGARVFRLNIGRRGQCLSGFKPHQVVQSYLDAEKSLAEETPHKQKHINARRLIHRESLLENALDAADYFGAGKSQAQRRLAKIQPLLPDARKVVEAKDAALKAKNDAYWKAWRDETARQESEHKLRVIEAAQNDEKLEQVASIPNYFSIGYYGQGEPGYEYLAEHPALVKAEHARRQASKLADWRAGKPHARLDYDGPVYLRVRHLDINEKTVQPGAATTWTRQLETSKGATIPLDAAERTFKFIQSKRAAGWHKNGEQFDVGGYPLDAVNEQGVVVGCHRVGWDEIESFAKAQGWL